jgi:poly(3-hydroxybutyrate) depolymerase
VWAGTHDRYHTLTPRVWHISALRARAAPRGWYVVMHDGGETPCAAGSHSTMGNENFQRHTEAVIQNVLCRFDIDKNRVYGYGFSMGGGEVLSYAARHRNPASNHGFFAAVVNHSGYFWINQRMSAGQPQNACSSIPDCMYGTSYCGAPFAWRRADVLDLEPINCPANT